MVVLKKLKHRLKGSTLMETLVATVLIVVIFMLASMILNNLFSITINNNTQGIDNHLSELQYQQQHSKLQLPYTDTFNNWNITIETYKENNQSIIEFEATNLKTNRTIHFIQNAQQ